MPLRAGAKGHLACTPGSVAHDRGRAPGSLFPRCPSRPPRRQHRPRISARPWVEVRPGLAAASRPPQLSFSTRAGCPPSASEVSSQRTNPPARDPPAQLGREGRTKARATVPGHHHSFPQRSRQLCRQALPSVRPSVPKAAPCFPELGPVRDRSLPTLARRAQEAVTPRRLRLQLQRPSSRHLVWRRRSRGRRHAERLGRREGGDGGGRGRGQSSRVSSARRRHRGRRHSGRRPR